jgi:putative adhesin
MRVSHTILPLLIPALLPMTGCIYLDIDGMGRFNRDFHYSFPMKAGGRLSVESFNGSVEVSAWDQDNVDISGTKYAPTAEQADAMKVDVDHAPDAVSVRAARQYEWHGNHGVRFAIKVPRGAVVDRIATSNGSIHVSEAGGPARLKSSNGSIRIEKFHGNLDAQTSNSPIELDQIDGDAVAHSSNGRVEVRGMRGSLDVDTSNSSVTAEIENPGRPVRVETRNGRIDLTLPGGFTGGVRAHTNNSGITLRLADPVNARVSARTSNSSVTSDFDARMRGEIRKNEIDGEIGTGGMLLDLTTSNGSIRLLRR